MKPTTIKVQYVLRGVHGSVEIEGYKADLDLPPEFSGYDFVVHHPVTKELKGAPRLWVVSEARSGSKFTSDCATVEEAQEEAVRRLLEVGPGKLQRAVRAAVKFAKSKQASCSS